MQVNCAVRRKRDVTIVAMGVYRDRCATFATSFEHPSLVIADSVAGGRRVQWEDPGWATDADRARIPVMNADVILESTERRIILDTKYYKDALARGRGPGTGKLHSANLYQLLAYVRNRQATRPDGPVHEGILLYPQVGDEELRADIRLEGFRIQARTVNLDQDWRLIHEEMLETVGAGGG